MYSIYADLRDKKGMTDYAVAKAIPIGRSILSDWKTGKHIPNKDNLKKIADYFQVTIDYIMYGERPTPEAKAQVNNIFHSLPPNETYTDSLQDAFNNTDFMEHIALLWALHEEDRKAIYKSIKGLYYAAKEDKEKEAVLNELNKEVS